MSCAHNRASEQDKQKVSCEETSQSKEMTKQSNISSFHRSVNELYTLLRCYRALNGSYQLTTNQRCVTSRMCKGLKMRQANKKYSDT